MINKFTEDYEAKKKAILENEDLSKPGMAKALDKLERDRKAEDRELIQKLRKTAILAGLEAKELQNERKKLAVQARDSMDYSRLLYESMNLRAQIEADKSPLAVLELWERAKEGSDVYVIRSWKDAALGLLPSLGGSDYTDLTGKILQDIAETEEKLIKEPQRTEEEKEAVNMLRDVESDARLLNSVYRNGDAVVNRIFNGISLQAGEVELAFSRQETENPLTGSKRLESKEEVYYRIEREYDDKAEAYSQALQDRGLEPMDKDFNDLTGAF